jgi:hypothetical protein
MPRKLPLPRSKPPQAEPGPDVAGAKPIPGFDLLGEADRASACISTETERGEERHTHATPRD